MASYARHTARFERSYRHALGELRHLQTNRNLAAGATGSGPVLLSSVTDVAKLLKQSQESERKRSKDTVPEPDIDPGADDLDTLKDILAEGDHFLESLEAA